MINFILEDSKLTEEQREEIESLPSGNYGVYLAYVPQVKKRDGKTDVNPVGGVKWLSLSSSDILKVLDEYLQKDKYSRVVIS